MVSYQNEMQGIRRQTIYARYMYGAFTCISFLTMHLVLQEKERCYSLANSQLQYQLMIMLNNETAENIDFMTIKILFFINIILSI